jgi:hypothetical protein
MVELGKFVHTNSGKHLMSLLLGLGLASLFRIACKGKNCRVFKAAPLEQIQDKIYGHDGKCYKYVYSSAKCSKNKRIVDFA